jgi:hypothetical protein
MEHPVAFDDFSHARTSPAGPKPIELWRLHGATDDLRGLAIETSFGYALGLELDAELILLHLQPSLESLMAFSDRIESALLHQGWRPAHHLTSERSFHA